MLEVVQHSTSLRRLKIDQILLNQVRLPRYQPRTILFCQRVKKPWWFKETEDQDFLIQELEDLLVEELENHDVGKLIFDNYIEK